MANLDTAEVTLRANVSQFERAMSGAANKMRDAGAKMSRIGAGMTTALTLPLAGAGVAALKMASDAEEAANKFNVVMGGSADRVRKRLEDLTSTIPLTTSEMQGLAAGIQDMLVPMGLVRDEAADMSADMVQLAADLGSFNNVSPDRVLEAMQSALAGASEPMRRFGVDTRVARLEALAYEEGLIGVGEKLDNTAMAQAVMLAIQRDSTDAMGDAARTVDSTANQLRFLARDVKQLAIEIGQALIPILTPMIKGLRDAVNRFAAMSDGMKTTVVVLAGLAAAAGPVLLVVGQMTLAISGLTAALATLKISLGPAGWLIAGLTAVAAVVIRSTAETEKMRKEFQRAEEDTRKLADSFEDLTEAQLEQTLAGVRAGIVETSQRIRELYVEMENAPSGGMGIQQAKIQAKIDKANVHLERQVSLLVGARDAMGKLGEKAAEALTPPPETGDGGLVAPMIRDFGRASEELDDLRDRLADLLYEESKGGTTERLKPIRDEIKLALADIAKLESAVARMNTEAGEQIQGMRPDVLDTSQTGMGGINTGPITVPETIKPIEDGNEALKLTEEQLGAVQIAAQGFGDAISNAFTALVTGSQNAAGAFASTMLSAIAQIANAFADLWIAEGVAMAASGNFAGAAGKFAAAAAVKALGGMISGAARSVSQASRVDVQGRRTGGPMIAGHTYEVGEYGRELVTPMSNAVVTPNADIPVAGGGSSVRDILRELGPQPRIMSPNEAALDSWWREFTEASATLNMRRG